MRRNHFLASLLLIAVTPHKALAKNRSPFERPKKGIKIAKGEGRIHGNIRLGGPAPQIIDIKISGTDTDGDLAVFEQTILARGANVALHVHPDQDEVFYILKGSYRFKVGDDLFDLQAGDSIFLPRKVPHAWIVLSENSSSLVLVQPAGKLEEFFVAVSAIAASGIRPTPEQIVKLSADHGMNIVGERLTLD